MDAFIMKEDERMTDDVRTFNATKYQVLTPEEAQEVHSTSLTILEDIGTIVHHDEAIALLKKAGAYVENGNRVYLPTSLVEWAIRTAPSRVVVYDRNGKTCHVSGRLQIVFRHRLRLPQYFRQLYRRKTEIFI